MEQHEGENVILSFLILYSGSFSWLWNSLWDSNALKWNFGFITMESFICFSCVIMVRACCCRRTVGILSLTHSWTLSLWSDLWLVGLSRALHEHEKMPHELYVSCLRCDPMTLGVLNLHRTVQLFISHASSPAVSCCSKTQRLCSNPSPAVYIGDFLLRQHSTWKGTSEKTIQYIYWYPRGTLNIHVFFLHT